jgi:ribosome assembly protein 1
VLARATLIDEVCAGNVVGIGGLSAHVLKSATLSSTVWECRCSSSGQLVVPDSARWFFGFQDAAPALAALFMPAAPILRVAVEPSRIGDMPKLVWLCLPISEPLRAAHPITNHA